MTRLIEMIQIPLGLGGRYSSHSGEGADGWLGPLASLNIFVGANNCGKSALLRTLFSSLPDSTTILPADDRCDDQAMVAEHLAAALKQLLASDVLKDNGQTKSANEFGNIEELLVGFASNSLLDRAKRLQQAPTILCECMNGIKRVLTRITCFDLNQERNRDALLGVIDEHFSSVNTTRSTWIDEKRFVGVYIPTLRGLRPLARDGNLFGTRTADDYFGGNQHDSLLESRTSKADRVRRFVITGQELFKEVRIRLLGKQHDRQSISAFQQFLANGFFAGQPVTLIPNETEQHLYISIGNEQERPVHELGDGLQHIILQTLPLFLFQNENLLLFIEEPELFLHPGFQRLLIEAFAKPLGHGTRQVFVTTHSPQFIDLTLDRREVALFRVSKSIDHTNQSIQVAKFRVDSLTEPDESLLEHLGIKPSSVMLANCTIWVEGVTDRDYLRHYLELHRQSLNSDSGRAYVEDLHYAFVMYGGSQIVHYSFLDEANGIDVKRLCGRLLLVADRDKGKDARHNKLKTALGERFVCLPRREMENLLTPAIIREVLKSHDWQDNELTGANYEDYADQYLGPVIASMLPKNDTTKRKRVFAAESGTIAEKVEFAKRAIAAMKSMDDMSPDAKELAKQVYDFIADQNRVQ